MTAAIVEETAGEIYVLPTSFAQQRLWFLDQIEPGSSAYNVPSVTWLKNELDVAALERSINEIVRRHEVLRTTFRAVEGEPMQVISPALRVTLPVIDLSQLEEPLRTQTAESIADEEAGRGFDLARGPLLRSMVVRCGEDEHCLLLTMHHIISDGWSMGILMKEVTILYKAYKNGLQSPLPELPIQYADYAHWQREWLQGETLETEIRYWKKQLDNAPAVLALPTDRPRSALRSNRSAAITIELSDKVSEQLNQVCRREGVTMYMVLLAGFVVLLARHAGTNDIVVGTPAAGRGRVETEGLIGFFINTLVLRVKVAGDESFSGLLKRVRDIALDAQAHQNLPFEKLVQELQPERSWSHTPIFQVVFAFNNIEKIEKGESSPDGAAAGAVGRTTKAPTAEAKFDLHMFLRDVAGRIKGIVEYSADLFNEPTVIRMSEHYKRLLEAVASDPAQRVSELPIIGEAERRRLLVEWSGTRSDYPSESCVHELFRAQAVKTPDSIALRYEAEHLTYAELDARSNRLAHLLRSRGVGYESVVAVLMERSLELVVSLLAVLKAGAAYLPLDLSSPRERLAFMLEDAGAAVVLTQQSLQDILPEGVEHVIRLDADSGAIDASSADDLDACLAGGNLAYVNYTSGSTGRPKGVRIIHRGVVRLVKETNYADFSGVFLQLAPASFDAATFEVWGALLNGGELVVMPAGTPSLAAIAEVIERYHVTTLWLTAALFQQMVDFHPDALRGVRLLLAGGDVLPVEQVRKVISNLGDNKLINGYGPTENTTFTCCHVMSSRTRVDWTVPIGRPITNTQVYVLDARMGPVPIGVSGELYIGGDGLARDYLRRPGLTAERFLPDPFSTEGGARLYRTGDLARFCADGEIEFLGRSDHQVKVRGFRVELGEIEAALAKHPDVRQAVVVARDGAGSATQLVAYVVCERGVEASELQQYLREQVPEYMVPGWILMLDEMPLTPNTKIDRDALSKRDLPGLGLTDEFVAPRDVLEFKVTEIWEKVLDVRPIGVRDNFFNLGGHSLAAVRLMAQLRDAFGRELPLSILFQNGTVEQLASMLREQPGSLPESPLVGIKTSGARPPFFCVHPIGGNVLCYSTLAQHLGADQPFYGLQSMNMSDDSAAPLSLEESAAHYIKAMREVQPRGPYFLGGWSLGGVLAFEIARQLHEQRRHTALLALMDSWAPLEENKPREVVTDDAKLLAHLARSYKMSLPDDDVSWLDSDEQVESVLERAKKAHLLPPEVGAAWLRRLLELHRNSLSAVLDYEPAIYPGRITLFRAERSAARDSAPDDWGWGRLSAEPVSVHAVPGDHHTMLSEPHVQTLAGLLAAQLEAAQD
jgi:amino acid adenylation domain-containing protein